MRLTQRLIPDSLRRVFSLVALCSGWSHVTVAQAHEEPLQPIRNVILIIGDGMGPAQIGLLQSYARLAPNSPYAGPTALQQFADRGRTGISSTEPHGGLVADSACSASQLATGQSVPSEAISVNPAGVPVQTVLERAQATGRAVGLVSDTRMTHATPAAFASHVAHRSMENEIAEQLLQTRVDVLLSGGWRHFLPASVNAAGETRDRWAARLGGEAFVASHRADDRDLIAEAEAGGYTAVFDVAGLLNAVETGGPLLGLFSASSMQNAFQCRDLRHEPTRTQPGLDEMAQAALSILEDDPDGFFLMIEAGQIDWAGHANDAGWLLQEMLRLDAMLQVVLEWSAGRDDTLIILTADHETGGFGISYSHAHEVEPITIPGGVFENRPFSVEYDFVGSELLDRLAAQRGTLGDVADLIHGMVVNEAALPGAADLQRAVSAVTGFELPANSAAAIVDQIIAQHVSVEFPSPPADFHTVQPEEHADCLLHDFYPYEDNLDSARIARSLGALQGIVWSTGTHTASPVPVFAVGPASVTERFAGLLHHTEVGRALMQVLEPAMTLP
jgi:alkaline phosphatase